MVRKVFVLITMLAVITISIGVGISDIPRLDYKPKSHDVIFTEDSNVYDGDTIQDVYIDVTDLVPKRPYPAEMIFPGIFLADDDVYAFTDIRIAGIDTPEKRPTKAGRTEESLAAEKAAAAKAQKALDTLLKTHEYRFEIENPQPDKYWGRMICEVFVGSGADRISVSEYMIENGHAYRYEGDTKKDWDDGWYKIKP